MATVLAALRQEAERQSAHAAALRAHCDVLEANLNATPAGHA